VITVLLTPEHPSSVRLDGVVHSVRTGRFVLAVTVNYEGGKVDLNYASRETLQKLFWHVTRDDSLAATILAAVEDWRDPDDLPRFGGAEADAYVSGGSSSRPRNAWMRSVGELRLLAGMNDELFARLAVNLTVYGHRDLPDIRTAPRSVLAVFTRDDHAATQQLLREHEANPMTAAQIANRSGQAFTIAIEASGPTATIKRSAIVRLTGDPQLPFVVHGWN
jgi:general secretion pathway protein K